MATAQYQSAVDPEIEALVSPERERMQIEMIARHETEAGAGLLIPLECLQSSLLS